jgi:hypothetical protein
LKIKRMAENFTFKKLLKILKTILYLRESYIKENLDKIKKLFSGQTVKAHSVLLKLKVSTVIEFL